MNQPYSEDYFYISHVRRSTHFRMNRNHTHQSYELYYLAAGNINYLIQDTSFSLKKGDLILISPSDPHSTYTLEQVNHERYLLNIHADYFAPFLAEEAITDLFGSLHCGIYSIPSGYQDYLVSLFSSLLSEHKSKLALQKELTCLRAAEVFLFLSRLAQSHPEQVLNKDLTKEPAGLYVHQGLSFIEENYTRQITINDICKEIGISPYYFCRLFKESTNFTIIQHVNYLRIHKSQELLTTTKKSISTIAHEVGFPDSSYFSRIFRKSETLSPNQFRKLYQKK